MLQASISKLAMDNRVEIELVGFDILDQNKGVTYTTGTSFIEERRSESLGRYVMLKVTYRLGSRGAATTRRGATRIGARGGISVVFAIPLLDKLKIDDGVGAIPVHLMAGSWGTVAVVLTNPDATIFGQLASIAIVGVFVFGASGALWLAVNAVMGIRVTPEHEMAGLDSSELGMEAYPEFGKGSQFI